MLRKELCKIIVVGELDLLLQYKADVEAKKKKMHSHWAVPGGGGGDLLCLFLTKSFISINLPLGCQSVHIT